MFALLCRQAANASNEVLSLPYKASQAQTVAGVTIHCLAMQKARQIHGYDHIHRPVIGRGLTDFQTVLAKQRVQRTGNAVQPEREDDNKVSRPGDGRDGVGEGRVLLHTGGLKLFHFGTAGTRAI